MKKVFAMILTAMLLFLPACGAPATEGTESPVSEAPETASQEAAAPEEAETQTPEEAETPVPEEAKEELSFEGSEETENPFAAEAAATGLPEVLSFTTTDMDGNPIDSAELFGAHRYTMMNLWATWCPPCIMELPELQRLSKEWEAHDCAVVGFLTDGDEEAAYAEGVELLADAGAEYLNILPWENWMEELQIQALPTTIFLNEKGEPVGQVVVGADPASYERVMTSLTAE